MQVRQTLTDAPWTPELTSWLAQLRQQRAFDAPTVLAGKVQVLTDVFRQQGLTAAVVGVSGGVDSALVLALLVAVQRQPNSPLRQVLPLLLPRLDNQGVSGQPEATERGRAVCAALGLSPVVVDVGPVAQAVETALAQALPTLPMTPWARGQMVANARTPLLYTATSLLSAAGERPVVVGTTNRDEGAYLGYVGKASDGMVDVQPISDLHKSEVYALARLLGVPEVVLDAIPTGDMYDATPDEGVFGAPYDFVEGFLLEKSLRTAEQTAARQRLWSHAALTQYHTWAQHLEALHRYNAHKYTIGSPAYHLDLLDSAVPGGWRPACARPQGSLPATRWAGEAWAAPFALPAGARQAWLQAPARVVPLPPSPVAEGAPAQGMHVHQLVSAAGLSVWREALDHAQAVPAGADGRWNRYTPDQAVHSYRATVDDPELAEALWQRLKPLLPTFCAIPEDGHTDKDAPVGSVWRPVGISSVMRCIAYPAGGSLVPHYDAPFVSEEGQRTLMSVVVYLDATDEGGELRFLVDPQRALPLAERTFDDGRTPAGTEPAWARLQPQAGDVVVFDHRLRHESTVAPQGKRVVRTDVVFERVGPLPRPGRAA